MIKLTSISKKELNSDEGSLFISGLEKHIISVLERKGMASCKLNLEKIVAKMNIALENNKLSDLAFLSPKDIKKISKQQLCIERFFDNNVEYNNFIKDMKYLYREVYNNYSEKEFHKTFATQYTEILDITVCPYCNRNYINNRVSRIKKYVRGSQLDHINSQSNHPLLTISLNNLVPVCSTCNLIKSKYNIELNPYDIKNDDINFTLVIEDLNDNLDISFDISINPDINSEDIKKYEYYLKTLGLSEAYEIHKKDVEELYARHQIYVGIMADRELSTRLLNLSISSIEDISYGLTYEPREDKNNSLSKFRRDLIQQFKNIVDK